MSTDFYWHQLVGLQVFSQEQDVEQRLGVVESLLETGANDVLVVKGDRDSIDREERLIPYSDEFVLKVNLPNHRIDVVWDPKF
jgi:16S rRNA processing protein RimM